MGEAVLDEWSVWQEAARRREAAAALTPLAVSLLGGAMLALAETIGRAELTADEQDALAQKVRDRLAGRLT